MDLDKPHPERRTHPQMRTPPTTFYQKGTCVDKQVTAEKEPLYQKLKKTGNPQAAVQTALTLLRHHSPKEAAKVLGISTRWAYILKKRAEENNYNPLACLGKRGPKSPMPTRTPRHIEEVVVDLAKKTNLGPRRLGIHLQACGIFLSPFTIRNILRRYHFRCRKVKTVNGSRRYVADLSSFSPLQMWQIDAKYLADANSLPPPAYAAIFRHRLPRYQFTAIDLKTRIRFIAFAYQLTFTNGLAFMLLLKTWLRAFGVTQPLFFQTDNGPEFGG